MSLRIGVENLPLSTRQIQNPTIMFGSFKANLLTIFHQITSASSHIFHSLMNFATIPKSTPIIQFHLISLQCQIKIIPNSLSILIFLTSNVNKFPTFLVFSSQKRRRREIFIIFWRMFFVYYAWGNISWMNTMKMPSDNKFALFYFEKKSFSHKIYTNRKKKI